MNRLPGVILVAMLLVFSLMPSSAQAQDGATEIGNAPNGLNAIEVIGQIDQAGFDAVVSGYVTHIYGLPDELLFAPETPPAMRSEATARVTFRGVAQLNARSVFENLTSTISTATVEFYVNETPLGSTFEDTTTFASGTPVATYTVRFQSVINVQEPNVGVLMQFGEGVQQTAEPFTLGGQSYRLGHVGQALSYTNFGQGFRSSEEPLAAQYFFVGRIQVVGEGPVS